MKRVTASNFTFTDKFKDIDLNLAESNRMFEEKMEKFDPTDYNLLSKRQFEKIIGDTKHLVMDQVKFLRMRI